MGGCDWFQASVSAMGIQEMPVVTQVMTVPLFALPVLAVLSP